MARSARLVLVLAIALAGGASPASAPGNGCPLPCSGQTSSPPDDRLLYVQPEGAAGPVRAYDTRTGKLRFSLPAGRTSADGRAHFATYRARHRTHLLRWHVANGEPWGMRAIRGAWTLTGVSPTGRWLTLSRRLAAPQRTRIGIANGRTGRIVHTATLRGNFEVDTISSDGTRLFLIEHLRSAGAPRYLVRLYDVRQRALRKDPLRAPGEARIMAGLAWSGVASPDGRWLLTLYLNTARNDAFVHALDLRRSSPACIDLPSGRGAFDRLKRYTLTLSPDGQRLYATNPAVGAVAEIDLRTRRVVRTSSFRPVGWSGAATRLAGTISRNGRTLYFSGGRDLWAYDAAYGVVRGPYRTGGRVLGFGFGQGDRRVHALRADGRMLTFEAATGARLRA